jgi:hypothetical protein
MNNADILRNPIRDTNRIGPGEQLNRQQNGNIMRACIRRGSKQIGAVAFEIKGCGQRLLVDFGLPLDAEVNNTQHLLKIIMQVIPKSDQARQIAQHLSGIG